MAELFFILIGIWHAESLQWAVTCVCGFFGRTVRSGAVPCYRPNLAVSSATVSSAALLSGDAVRLGFSVRATGTSQAGEIAQMPAGTVSGDLLWGVGANASLTTTKCPPDAVDNTTLTCNLSGAVTFFRNTNSQRCVAPTSAEFFLAVGAVTF